MTETGPLSPAAARGRVFAGLSAVAPSGAALAVLTLLVAGPGHAGGGALEREGGRRGYGARIAEYQAIMDRFYRGESLHDARERLVSLVDGYNDLVAARNREIEAEEKKLDGKLAPLRRTEKEIEEMDKTLERRPDRTDADAVRAYNTLVTRRNDLVKRTNRLGRAARASIDAYNRKAERSGAELDSRGKKLEAMRAELNARIDAHERFQKTGKDMAFFIGVNRLYGRLQEERRRSGGTPELDRAAGRLRAIRRELGAHAVARHRSAENGLVVVEAVVGGDELCFLILDTGAMLTTIAPGIIDALGLTGELGEEVELVVAGGGKIRGRECVLRRLTVAGRTERNVAAAAVRESEVGVDGLLGQSFLKRFVYTIDESRKQKLILRPREGK